MAGLNPLNYSSLLAILEQPVTPKKEVDIEEISALAKQVEKCSLSKMEMFGIGCTIIGLFILPFIIAHYKCKQFDAITNLNKKLTEPGTITTSAVNLIGLKALSAGVKTLKINCSITTTKNNFKNLVSETLINIFGKKKLSDPNFAKIILFYLLLAERFTIDQLAAFRETDPFSIIPKNNYQFPKIYKTHIMDWNKVILLKKQLNKCINILDSHPQKKDIIKNTRQTAAFYVNIITEEICDKAIGKPFDKRLQFEKDPEEIDEIRREKSHEIGLQATFAANFVLSIICMLECANDPRFDDIRDADAAFQNEIFAKAFDYLGGITPEDNLMENCLWIKARLLENPIEFRRTFENWKLTENKDALIADKRLWKASQANVT